MHDDYYEPKSINAIPPCALPTDISDWIQLRNDMLNAIFQAYLNLCSQPPCGSGTVFKNIRVPLCWKIQNIPETINTPATIRFIACTEAFCLTQREICYDYSITPPSEVIINETKTQIGVSSCMTLEEYWLCCVMDSNVPWTTDCIQFFDCE